MAVVGNSKEAPGEGAAGARPGGPAQTTAGGQPEGAGLIAANPAG